MAIEDIVNENIDQFRCFWLDWSNKVKYIDLFKRGITSGNTLGLFFIKDSKAVLELTRYYKDFKRIVIYDVKGTINLLKDYDSIDEFNDPRVEYVYVGQNLPMKFDKIIMNPPYNLGNKITEAVLSSLNDDGDCVCLMPLSQYKRKELYRHVESFELADPGLFEDAVITENLSICTLKKENVGKYGWMDLVLKSVDQSCVELYKWNIAHNRGIVMRYARDKPLAYFDKDLDFLETARCTKPSGGGFGKNGIGYKWNILHDCSSVNSHIGQITFKTAKARNNFAICWYSGDNSRKHLLGRAASGIKIQEISAEYYFFIPQIDWSNIHINQKELWDKGLYDEAVLSEMGLKWNADKTVIIKDE